MAQETQRLRKKCAYRGDFCLALASEHHWRHTDHVICVRALTKGPSIQQKQLADLQEEYEALHRDLTSGLLDGAGELRIKRKIEIVGANMEEIEKQLRLLETSDED